MQSSMVIDNGPGLNVRQDINSAFMALVTVNSGAVEPAEMYASMLWLDLGVAGSPNGVLRMRNNANTAWVKILDSNAVLTVPVPLSQGGTGATDAAGARVNFGVDKVTNVKQVQNGSAGNTITLDWTASALRLWIDSTVFTTWPIEANNTLTIGPLKAAPDQVKAWGFAGANKFTPYMRHSDNSLTYLVRNESNVSRLQLDVANSKINVYDDGNNYLGGMTIAGSDERIKENIEDCTLDVAAHVQGMRFIAFNYNAQKTWRDPVQRHEIGFSAQNLQGLSDQYVLSGPDGMLAPNYEKLLPAAFKAIQKLLARVDALESAVKGA